MMGLIASQVEVDIEKGVCRIEKREYPLVGYGSYLQMHAETVDTAAKNGYRIIDTATYYKNFEGIAEAFKEWNRKDFYIISKVWRDEQQPDDLRKDLERALEQLQMDYIDAYLLHLPNSEIPIEKTLTAMEELRRAKKIRHIGLSNVSINHIKRALEVGVPITWVQNEMHPHFYDPQLLAFCKAHGIGVQAWAPLGRGRLSRDPFLAETGKKYGKTAAQVAIRWIVQHGCIPLPGSKNPLHIQENSDIWDFELTKEEMEAIDKTASQGERERFKKEVFGFEDEFDFSYEECWPKN
jgi:diketogulonate reductase-like aldo/keto reductase